MATLTTEYAYDAAGNRTKLVYPSGDTVYYAYDSVNRLERIYNDSDDKAAYYRYDATGNITREIKANNTITYYEYDGAGRLARLQNVKSDNSLISSFQYDRDKAGNITKCYRGDGATVYYEYDRAQRLASEVWKDSGMSEIYSFKYDYDGVGNRSKMLRNLGGGAESTYYYYDAANRLEKEWNETAGTTTYFGYDDNGSVLRIQTPTGTTYFSYNDNDLVKQVVHEGGGACGFRYDGRNQRVVVEDSDGTAYFQWDGLDPVEERDASGGLTAKYVHGFTGIAGIGSLTYMKQGVNCLVPHKDNTGSIRELSDDSEDVVKYYEYDAFGTKLKESGNQVNRFQFSANYMQLKVLENIYLSPTRVYHAGIGRFLQKDRIRFGAPYTYVTNQPTKYVDPAGLQKEPTVGENVGITWDNGDGTKSSAWGRLVESANEYIIIQKSDGTYITVCREWIADGPHWMPSTTCLLYTSPSPRDLSTSRMPSSA